jgi:hypothetical protein
MIPIKVQCACGQKYAFDVEPVNGRMPQPVKCPACGADGTAAANEIIAQTLGTQPQPRPVSRADRQDARPTLPPPLPAQAAKAPAKKSRPVGWLTAAIGGTVLLAVLAAAAFLWWHQSSAGSRDTGASAPTATQPSSPTKASTALPAGFRYKNQQVTLPPEIAAFIAAKEREAEGLVHRQNQELDPAIKDYFTQVLAGHLGAAQLVFHGLSGKKEDPGGSSQSKGPVWQDLIDADLTVDALGASDPDLVLAMAREMTNSLAPGCIYFGGTDPGRGLPTMLCRAPGDPFFVVSQNPLCDGGYLDYLRAEFGASLRLPTTNEVQKCFDDYTADVQARQAANQLMPGEDVHRVNGKAQVSGQVAVMRINALIAKVIFDSNPDREFYVEESFPLDWMYPYVIPNGLLMRLQHQPLTSLPPEDLQRDADFWSGQMVEKTGFRLTQDTSLADVCAYAKKVFADRDRSGLQGNARFMADPYSCKAWSKWRASIAGMYAWRLMQAPPEYRAKKDPERQEVRDAADLAFRQAFALCPYSPEALFRYVNFLVQDNRVDDALLVAKTSLACSPKDNPASTGAEQIKALIGQLESFKNQRH